MTGDISRSHIPIAWVFAFIAFFTTSIVVAVVAAALYVTDLRTMGLVLGVRVTNLEVQRVTDMTEVKESIDGLRKDIKAFASDSRARANYK